ncbi:hypothetical protein [Kocuria sp.]|uniref:hypothetical protein n=1 Tax=Kocuria sp. TaxID=1871328 RepID=UPI0026DB0048|nr:hypothetical protein [Kocuria sp.]MDO4920078.1 hypothetical protein [Kocuria sp.]
MIITIAIICQVLTVCFLGFTIYLQRKAAKYQAEAAETRARAAAGATIGHRRGTVPHVQSHRVYIGRHTSEANASLNHRR